MSEMEGIVNDYIMDTPGTIKIKEMIRTLRNKYAVRITADALKKRCDELGREYVS
jgi:hypothetical protein